MRIKTNAFGKRLEQLMLLSGQKNTALAEFLGYDVSYISKWIGAKSIPAIKNRDDILLKISTFIAQNLPNDAIGRVREIVNDDGGQELYLSIKESLFQAYNESLGIDSHVAEKHNDIEFIVAPGFSKIFFDEHLSHMSFQKEADISMVVDLHSLEHSVKLKLAGIDKGHFRITKMRSDIRYHMSIYLNAEKMDIVYDTILMIHMLTGYSFIDFELYKSKNARGKLDYVVNGQYAILGSLKDNGQCRYITHVSDTGLANQLYQSYTAEENQENLLFQKSDMHKLLMNHTYMQSLLAPDVNWLLGHMTEQFIPNDLLEEILGTAEDDWLHTEIVKVHMLMNNVFEAKNINIMFYESAIYNFMLNGEMDFYNTRVIMGKQQRISCLEYMRKIVTEKNNIHISMIEGGFSDDFRYITNPCVFLSETVGYLRLENKNYTNNILVVKDKELMGIFKTFYTEIWNNRCDVVTSDRNRILERIDYYISSLHLMPDIE